MKLPGLNIIPMQGDVCYFNNLFETEESDLYFEVLMRSIAWSQEQIKMFGKLLDMPRLTAWYGDEGCVYTYSGVQYKPVPWTKELLAIKQRIESLSGTKFNSVLLNLYRNGKDGMGWHSDDERELGNNPVIGSVSFGETRTIKFRHKETPNSKIEIALTNGSFLLMKGETQHHWMHAIPKTSQQKRPRINLTFRAVELKQFIDYLPMALAITIFWISLVPSPIVQSLLSR